MPDVGTTTEDLERYLAQRHLVGAGLPREGQAPARKGHTAAHWRWEGIHDGLMQSGRIVTVGFGGMTGMRSVVGIEARQFPIHMNAQILMPGERTECHRTMRSETRLVCQAPPEAVFVCEFEAYPMERGDVVISPPWTYHDHWNPGSEPAIWVDAYDDGHYKGGSINEKLPNGALYQEVGAHLRPTGGRPHLASPSSEGEELQELPFPLPPMRYPWRETKAALDALRAGGGAADPYEGLHLMLASPVDNGPTLPTFAWHVQLLEAHQGTLAHRHNSTTFYHVFEGEGATTIEGERLEWGQGDLFAVPAWAWHQHTSTFGADTILFSVDDWPAMKKLGFYRKEEASA